MIPSLYLHIPFCDSLCHYCDFGKVLTGTFSQEKYIDSLLIELDSLAIPDDSLKTIYIGGGTPSALKPTRAFNAFAFKTSLFVFFSD